MKPLPTGHLPDLRPSLTRTLVCADETGLLDLGFAELDVLARDRIVFLLDQLVGLRARVLLGHVIEAGIGARYELDLDGGGLGHGGLRMNGAGIGRAFAGKLTAQGAMSRKAPRSQSKVRTKCPCSIW